MRFDKLRVLGFKSFVEPTEFLIKDGLTGVVGPNGCGKSNLVEALKWVMGESSYKNMRASGMDDVIFSGSLNRPSRNTAEVTLVLDNTDRTAPAGFNDSDVIEVTRRIEREAGSVYKINGKDARAKDVQLLFADASTGSRSPSMVGQGRIGELIAAKPRQRRAILEEAAGISGLHSRRHEAELRLKGAEQNLERLDDVVGQLENQIESLKRQARQANRYRNLSSEIRKLEAMLFHLRWLEACDAELQANTTLTEHSSLVGAAAEAQAKTARDQAVTANNLPGLRDKAAEAGAALQRIRVEQQSLTAEAERTKTRTNELKARVEQLDHDISREKQLIDENTEIITRLDDEEKSIKEEIASSSEREELAQKTRDEARTTLESSESALNETSREIAEINARRTQLQNAQANNTRRVEKLKEQLEQLLSELKASEEKLGDDLAFNAFKTSVAEGERAVSEAETAVKAQEEKTQQARDSQTEASAQFNKAQQDLKTLETEAATLARMLNMGNDGKWPKLIDDVTAEPGYEVCLAAALGDDLDVSTDANAPIHWAGADINNNDPALPAGIDSLSDFVAAPPAIARRLAQIGVVQEAGQGNTLRSQLQPGQRLVSREGDIWRWDGFVATAEAKTPAAQRLEQKNRLADIEGEFDGKRERVSAEKTNAERAQAEVSQAIGQEKAARQTLSDKQRELQKSRQALAEAEKASSLLMERVRSMKAREGELQTNLSEATNAADEVAKQLADVPSVDALSEQLTKQQNQVAQDRAKMAEARAMFETLAREADLRKKRLSGIASERANWQHRGKNATSQIDILNQRRIEANEELERLADVPAEIERRRGSLFNASSEAEANASKANDALTLAETALKDADEAAKNALMALSTAKEARARSEERLEAAKTRKITLSEQIAETLEASPAKLPEMAEIKPDTPLPEQQAVETKLDRYKAERERLGGVNLRAEIELQEIDEQRENIIVEREDLIEAIRQLRIAIASLNKEGRERLLAAFDTVNGHFKQLFTHLFGGGTAELTLTESDDPLEAGLDILARPPGKKPQTMTLLSGGEQALTAMALIFAVFLTNPAPICVLDEVDAPLDDANVERFCALMEEMIKTTDTRFLTITHNPITMARMSRLFGVTMAERGVSQLVAVDLETAESFVEPAVA